MTYKVEVSSDIKTRNIRLMFWGAPGTRKTETVLRNFPHVLVIDAEGNAQQCTHMPEIPKFLRIATKNAREILDILDDISAGKIKFPDGELVETVSIDSVSVLWGVGQEVAAVSAEDRARKMNKKVDEANITQLDWVRAKRPMKRIMNRLAGSTIKYLVLIAREKDLYIEDKVKTLQKVGFTPDIMKGTDYDVNLALRFGFEQGRWFCLPTKTQGGLGRIFNKDEKLYDFPMQLLKGYTDQLHLSTTKETILDDEEVAAEQVREANLDHSQVEMIKIYPKTDGVYRKNTNVKQ